MPTTKLLWITAASCLFLAVAGLPAAEPAPVPRVVSAAELVQRLSSSDEREREEAKCQLLLLDAEPPELLRATDSTDPAVRDLAVSIVKEIRRRTADRVMRRPEQFGAAGKVDLLVASSATWALPAGEERLWLPAYVLGQRIAEKGKMRWPLTKGKATGFNDFIAEHQPDLSRLQSPFREPPAAGRNKLGACRQIALVAPGVTTTKAVSTGLIVSRDSVHVKMGIGKSILFVNGDLTCDDSLVNSVIICDGNIKATSWSSLSCILIARGNLTLRSATRCTLIAGGTVKFSSTSATPMEPQLNNVVKEGETNPLGFLTFFELSRVGVEVAEKDKAVRVAKLTDASPLRKAGVAVGDVVAKVDGTPVATAEELRRALRDAVATKGEAALTVVRKGKPTDIRVPLSD